MRSPEQLNAMGGRHTLRWKPFAAALPPARACGWSRARRRDPRAANYCGNKIIDVCINAIVAGGQFGTGLDDIAAYQMGRRRGGASRRAPQVEVRALRPYVDGLQHVLAQLTISGPQPREELPPNRRNHYGTCADTRA